MKRPEARHPAKRRKRPATTLKRRKRQDKPDGGPKETPGNTTPAPPKPPVYGVPPGASGTKDGVDKKGTRTIEYDDADGAHHTIVIDKTGTAHETVTQKGKPDKKRDYTVTFDPASGNRTETEETTDADGTTTTRSRTIDKNGKLVEGTESIFTPGKTGEYPAKEKRTTRKYDGRGRPTEKIEEEDEYTVVDPSFERQLTKGKRTTTPYVNGVPGKPKKEHYDPEKGWLPD